MAFVVSSGALRGIERAAPPPVYSMQVGANQYRDYAALYRAQPELRTVVDFLARNIAQLGLHVFRRVSDVDRTRLTDHPLAALLGKPNASTTPYRMIDALVHDICIFDNGFWLKVRDDDGDTRALRRVRPGRIVPTGDDWLEPEGYEILGSRDRLQVDASDVVHFRGYNPNDDRLGTPPVESLRQVLTEEWAANTYREQLWNNGARIAGYITRPLDAPDWGPKGRARFRDEFQAHYSGDSNRAGETPILDDGMTFVASGVTPRDSQAIEFRKLTREEVARSYHVPLPMVGILDHATFTNIKELHKNLYQDCLGPWLENMQQEIELQLMPDLPDTAGVYVEFNIAAKLTGSFEEQAVQLGAAIGAPYMVPNEGRARLNLPMIEGGDELIRPLNVGVTPTAQSEPAAAPAAADTVAPKTVTVLAKARAPQASTDHATDTLARFFTRQGAAVASALGAEKARGMVKASVADVFDTARWNGELAADLLLLGAKMALTAAKATMTAMGLDPADFDRDRIAGWLAAHADGVAKGVNATTADRLAEVLGDAEPGEALPAVHDLFDGWADSRATQVATTLSSAMSGFGTVEAGRLHGGDGVTKTWITGDNPRPAHAALDGETVDIDAEFSDGSRWPGGSGDPELDSNCNCDVTISVPAD